MTQYAPPPPPPPPAAQRLRENWDAALAWYSSLFKRGGVWIAVALLLPCCACSVLFSGAQSVGLIPKAATATSEPTATPRPTSPPRPTRPPRPTDTAEPPTATSVLSTNTPLPTIQLSPSPPATRAPQGLILPAPIQPTSDAPSDCIDINSASFENLRRIIHIEADRANAIITMRAQRRFRSIDDLTRVAGIAEKRLEDIKTQGIACVR